jgi:hypothetical protein
MNTQVGKEQIKQDIENQQPSATLNGVEVYITQFAATDGMRAEIERYRREHGLDWGDYTSLLGFLYDGESLEPTPWVLTASANPRKDVIITAEFMEQFGSDMSEGDELYGEFETALKLLTQAADVTMSAGGGDFTDEEIRGIASTLRDEDMVGELFIQIDRSGVSVRSDVPNWAIDEAERESNPFTVDGQTHMAFSGRGYTAVVRLEGRADPEADIDYRQIDENIYIHNISDGIGIAFK